MRNDQREASNVELLETPRLTVIARRIFCSRYPNSMPMQFFGRIYGAEHEDEGPRGKRRGTAVSTKGHEMDIA